MIQLRLGQAGQYQDNCQFWDDMLTYIIFRNCSLLNYWCQWWCIRNSNNWCLIIHHSYYIHHYCGYVIIIHWTGLYQDCGRVVLSYTESLPSPTCVKTCDIPFSSCYNYSTFWIHDEYGIYKQLLLYKHNFMPQNPLLLGTSWCPPSHAWTKIVAYYLIRSHLPVGLKYFGHLTNSYATNL